MLRLFQITRDRLVLYIVLCSVKLLHVYNGPQFDVLSDTVIHSTLPCVEVAFGTVPFVEGAGALCDPDSVTGCNERCFPSRVIL